MIKFDRFFQTIKKKGISEHTLSTKYKVSRNHIQRLRENKNITTDTLNNLCNILNCELNDILEFEKDQ